MQQGERRLLAGKAGAQMAMAQQLAACDTCFLLKPVEEYARPDGRWETTCLVGANRQAVCSPRKRRCMSLVLAAGGSGRQALHVSPLAAGLSQHSSTRGKARTYSGG